MKITIHSDDILYTIVFVAFIALTMMYLYKKPCTCKAETFDSMDMQPTKFDGQIDSLTYSKFKPECCATPYGNSKGCLCFKNGEYKTIASRGGNRPYTCADEDIEQNMHAIIEEKEAIERNRQRGVFVFPKSKVFDIMD